MAQRDPSRRIRAQQDAMTCQRVTAMIRDYLAGELAPEIAAALEEHLRDCPDCTVFINTYRRTAQALQSIRYEDIPAEMQSRVRQFLRAKIKRFPPDQGDPWQRDTAYHQGTVWARLMGPFITAYLKVNGRSRESLEQVAQWLAPFHEHLREAGLGHIAEIFDGDAPHRPRGCMAQAWIVAELLRATPEDVYGFTSAARQVYAQERIPIETLADCVRHVVQCTFNGRRIVIFSGGPAEADEMVLNEIRAIRDGGGFGSIIGRNSFQRKKSDAPWLLDTIMQIYAGTMA
jgi:hypothetical protein